MLKNLKRCGWGYILIAAFLIATGVCFISFNNVLNILAISIGVILIAYSIIFVIVTLAKRERGLSFAFKIGMSIAFLIAGTVTLIFGDSAVSIIADIFCLLLILDGAFKLQTSVFSKRLSVRGWWLLPIFAVAVIISSFILTKIVFTDDNMHILTIILGVIVITDGISNLTGAFFYCINEKRLEESYIASAKFNTDKSVEEGESHSENLSK